MRWMFLLLPLGLAGCILPGRQSFAPNPAGADTASIDAAQAFADRIPLVTILPGTRDFAGPVANAVHQALAIKPGAMFDVEAQAPPGATPDESAAALRALAPTASAVARSIASDGVAPENVILTAKNAGLEPDILIFVK